MDLGDRRQLQFFGLRRTGLGNGKKDGAVERWTRKPPNVIISLLSCVCCVFRIS